MVRNDRSKYTHFNVSRRWRIWVMDVPGDIIIGVDYLDTPHADGKWINLVHLDETKHGFFHAHIPPKVDEKIPLGTGLSKEDKLQKGFQVLAEYAKNKQIGYDDDILSPEDVWLELRQQVLDDKAAKGSAHHNVSIEATAHIVQSINKNIQKDKQYLASKRPRPTCSASKNIVLLQVGRNPSAPAMF